MTSVFSGPYSDVNQNGAYGVNNWHYAAGGPTPPHSQALGTVEYPSACVWLAETSGGASVTYDGGGVPGTNVHGGVFGGSENVNAAVRHNSGANFGFCDGHVKWYKGGGVKCSNGDCWYSITGT